MKISSYTNDGKKIDYFESFWTGAKEIKINDVKLVNKVGSKKIYNYNGMEYKIKGSIIFGCKLVNENDTIILVKNLSIIDWLFSIIPLILLPFGGAIGGGLAGLGFFVNITILKLYNNVWFKLLLAVAIAACAAGAWIAISVIIAFLSSFLGA